MNHDPEKLDTSDNKKPLSVAITSVVHEKNILLIKRANEPYAGKWAFPGGKVEHGEHITEAALRELKEETNIDAHFIEHCGCVSEHLIEDEKTIHHFLLHVCKLQPKAINAKEGTEGQVDWFPLQDLEKLEQLMVASDFAILKKYVAENQTGYTECALEKTENEYKLLKFE